MKKRLKKELNKRFGFTAFLSKKEKIFTNSNAKYILLKNIYFKEPKQIFREHLWIPVKRLRGIEKRNIMIQFTANIGSYQKNNGVQPNLINIQKIYIKE